MLSFLPEFLITRLFRRRKGCHIDMLSNDVLVDHIFAYLNVEDILAMRRVSKLHYYLTHTPIIWKRFLRLINIPLPPLPPTPRYRLGELDFEAERLVFRALSLDNNWRSFAPRTYRSQRLTVYNHVLAMKVLPGGKYLVASVGDSEGHRYAVIVYVLDHPTRGSVALAKTPTKSKAYNLQAKYMTWNEVQGISIAYIRRKFKSNKRSDINPSNYSHRTEIDPPMPLIYECICLHVALDALETLGDPNNTLTLQELQAQPPPFCEMARIRSSRALDHPSLVEDGGMPMLTVVKKPDEIVIKDLTTRVISTLKCERFVPQTLHPQLTHSISGVRFFPQQQQMFVIRSVPPIPLLPNGNPLPITLLEMYQAPVQGETTIRAANERFISTMEFDHFEISDPNLSTVYDSSIQPSLPAAKGPPPPVSIFCRMVKPRGIHHYMVWPLPVNMPARGDIPARSFYYYALRTVRFQSRHDCDPNVAHILPGAYRTLLYTVPSTDRTDAPSLVNLRRYIAPEAQPADYPVTQELSDEERVTGKRKLIPSNLFATLVLPKGLANALADDGVNAVAWDEGVGRVCIAPAEDSVIYILDFAKTPNVLGR